MPPPGRARRGRRDGRNGFYRRGVDVVCEGCGWTITKRHMHRIGQAFADHVSACLAARAEAAEAKEEAKDVDDAADGAEDQVMDAPVDVGGAGVPVMVPGHDFVDDDDLFMPMFDDDEFADDVYMQPADGNEAPPGMDDGAYAAHVFGAGVDAEGRGGGEAHDQDVIFVL